MKENAAAKKNSDSGKMQTRRLSGGPRRRAGNKPRWRRPSARQLERLLDDWSNCT